MMTSLSVTVRECTDPTGLFRQYAGESEPQGAYIELDLEDGVMLADYDGEIGNAVPEAVRHGRIRRYGIPLLTAAGANEVMAELRPLAQRVLDGAEIEWDGSNNVARLNADATAAEDAIEARLGNGYDGGPAEQHFDAEHLISVWPIEGATNGDEASEYGITAATTDERLAEIAAEILLDLSSNEGGTVAVCEGLEGHLRGLRDEAGEELRDVYWSVMDAASPDADAVEPGAAGITVPDSVLEWAAGHGLTDDNPDAYLLVAPQEGATDMDGEVACLPGRLSLEEGLALQAALAEQAAKRATERAERNSDSQPL